MKKKILVLVLALLMLCQFSVSAASSYKSYVYDNNGLAALAPDAFYYDDSVDLYNMLDNNGKIIGMKVPHDVFVYGEGENAKLYISGDDADGNGMVLILNADYSFNKVIRNFKNTITVDKKGNTKTIKKDTFGSVTNTFVDTNGNIYICDINGAHATEDNTNVPYDVKQNIEEEAAGRVIKLNKNFETEYVIVGVSSEILPDGFDFQPRKIVVDAYGRIFVLSKSNTMGIMEFDLEGEFVQCIGAPAVTYNVFELFWRAISTDAQKETMEDFVPTEYSGIDIDDEGFIFVTNKNFTESDYSEIACLSKLNAKGNDVLRRVEANNPYGDTDASWKTKDEGPSQLEDILTLDNGVYAVLDTNRGKVFFYNVDGVNLFNFGTKEDDLDDEHVSFVEGNLSNAVSLAWHDNQCLVVDESTHAINRYSTTNYANMIFEAIALHEQDKYDEEMEIWNEVIKLNNNSVIAKRNIGMVYYRNGDYITAMEYFKEIKDTENYSKAFKYQRQIYINDYFTTAVVVIIIAVVLWTIYKKWRKAHPKTKKPHKLITDIGYCKQLMFRPLNGAWLLAREGKGSVAGASTILAAVAVMSILQARFTGFIFSPNAEDVNLLAQMAVIVLPVMLFVVCNWCVTSLMAGEGSFKAIYMHTCYSLAPILFLYPVAILISNVMVADEGDFYIVFLTLAFAWVFLLLILGNMRIHDYTVGMAVIELLVTVVVMLLVVFLAILFMALVQQMASFVGQIIEELATR